MLTFCITASKYFFNFFFEKIWFSDSLLLVLSKVVINTMIKANIHTTIIAFQHNMLNMSNIYWGG